ncbi:hypothetical protein HK100_011835 [Physocladia obscura]|uniref:Uncharacterized protein n=1 Tax=Physocladia obscura TaxID=109957 RepID=A0AAD5T0Q4_9FUNG|nr:hypothetical protein HK100_011835 [Physocladia obscura]
MDRKQRVVLKAPIHTQNCNHYGQHISRGFSALKYLCGPQGTWRAVCNLSYTFNYYEKYATPSHPFDREKLLDAASHPPNMTTCRDADGILLSDFSESGEIDAEEPPSDYERYAFIEHWGMNEYGKHGTPFNHAWFDDNFIARVAMCTYSTAFHPWGLYESSTLSRFVVFEGTKTHDPYPNALEDPVQYPDQISLHALFLANNNRWEEVIITSDALIKKSGLLNDAEGCLIYQHIQSLFSHIKSLQLKIPGSQTFGNWKTGVQHNDGTLVNTETTVLAMLALGAGSLWKFEPLEYPMSPCPGFPQFPDTLPHVLCARLYEKDNVGDGLVSHGPFARFPLGIYSTLFDVRVLNVSGTFCLRIGPNFSKNFKILN